jgi:hypothetical protein
MSRPRTPILERVRCRIAVQDNGCWLWLGPKGQDGYGRVGSGGRNGSPLLVHRVTYEAVCGPVPDGLELDHLCRVRACCNPAHLEAVTRLENVRRGLRGPGSKLSHCRRGHPLEGDNVAGPDRHCRTCARARQRRYDERRRTRRVA